MRILSIQQVALTTDPDGTEVPLVFENGVFYKIFGNGFESAPFNHDSDNVNFLPVGQGYPTPMLGVITDGKLKLYTTYAPVDYVQLLEFADDTYTLREEVRESMIDFADVQKIGYDAGEVNITSVTHNNDGTLHLAITPASDTKYTVVPVYFECYGRRYYLNANKTALAAVTFEVVNNAATIKGTSRFINVVSHDDYN